MKHISPDTAHSRAAALCSRSEHAVSDVRAKLAAWGLPHHEIDRVIELLISENFVNERRYAHAYAHDKHAYNGWGRIKIAYQLRAKGIDQSLIDEAIGDIDPDSYRDTLLGLLRSKWREVSGRNPQQARAAMLRFAAGRGYEPSIIYAAVDQVMGACNDDCP